MLPHEDQSWEEGHAISVFYVSVVDRRGVSFFPISLLNLDVLRARPAIQYNWASVSPLIDGMTN